MWVPTPQGLRWCGAKSASTTPFDISKACLASVLPDSVDRDLYCSRGGTCPHRLGHGYTKVIKEMVPHPSELITVKSMAKQEAPKTEQGQPTKKIKFEKGTKGGRGGRGSGRGGRGIMKKE